MAPENECPRCGAPIDHEDTKQFACGAVLVGGELTKPTACLYAAKLREDRDRARMQRDELRSELEAAQQADETAVRVCCGDFGQCARAYCVPRLQHLLEVATDERDALQRHYDALRTGIWGAELWCACWMAGCAEELADASRELSERTAYWPDPDRVRDRVREYCGVAPWWIEEGE